MSIFNRISQIENKIGSIEARLAGSSGPPQVSGQNPSQVSSGQGAQFASIVDSLSEKDRFSPKASQSSGAVGGKMDSQSVKPLIAEAAATHGVDPALIEAVVRQESAYDAGAKSGVGAEGLMQLMPATAKELGVENSMDARQNVMGGTKYLKQLLARFDGNMTKAIAGYNAGPGAVEKYGGVPPFSETQNYVKKVLDNYQELKS